MFYQINHSDHKCLEMIEYKFKHKNTTPNAPINTGIHLI